MNFEEFKRHQKAERLLSGALILVAMLAPVGFTYLMQKHVHWLISVGIACALVASAIWIHFYRDRVAKKIKVKYESLDVGRVLAKKTRSHRYVITHTGYNHYYLKSLENGEKLLIPRRRIHEDYDISV